MSSDTGELFNPFGNPGEMEGGIQFPECVPRQTGEIGDGGERHSLVSQGNLMFNPQLDAPWPRQLHDQNW